jgi:hypothetical protein
MLLLLVESVLSIAVSLALLPMAIGSSKSVAFGEIVGKEPINDEELLSEASSSPGLNAV